MAKAKSNQVNLRLSKQAVDTLSRMVNATGSTKTSIVEQSIIYYARWVLSEPDRERLEVAMMGLPPLADDDRTQ